MTLQSGQVRVAGTGELFLAPLTSAAALPTHASDTIDPLFIGFGFTDTNGVVLSKSITREGVPAWQSTTPVRYLTTGQDFTVAVSLIQSNKEILKAWLNSGDFAPDGAVAPAVAGWRADIPTDPTTIEYKAVVRWQDDDITSLLTLGRLEITQTGDVALARQATTFPITLSALAPLTGNVLASWMTTDPAFGP